jgi:hypothetical protein
LLIAVIPNTHRATLSAFHLERCTAFSAMQT